MSEKLKIISPNKIFITSYMTYRNYLYNFSHAAYMQKTDHDLLYSDFENK